MKYLCEKCRVSASRAISWAFSFCCLLLCVLDFSFCLGPFFWPFCCFWPTCRAPDRAFPLITLARWVGVPVCLFVKHSQCPFLILNLCKVVKSSVTDAIKTSIEHQKGHQLAQRQRGTMRRRREEWEKVSRWWRKGINAITPGEHVLSRQSTHTQRLTGKLHGKLATPQARQITMERERDRTSRKCENFLPITITGKSMTNCENVANMPLASYCIITFRPFFLSLSSYFSITFFIIP